MQKLFLTIALTIFILVGSSYPSIVALADEQPAEELTTQVNQDYVSQVSNDDNATVEQLLHAILIVLMDLDIYIQFFVTVLCCAALFYFFIYKPISYYIIF